MRERDRVRISVVAGPDGYVTGEESAVVHYLNGGVAKPTFVPPRPFERGYRGRPTLIQNPETLAQLALVARFGSNWYRELGTVADPGSALVTITGAVRAPGVYELAFGTPMSDLLAAAGGPVEPLQALLVGGYFGTWIEASQATAAAARARGPALGGMLARVGRADRVGRERVRPARERAGDRVPGRAVGRVSAGRACTGCVRSPTRSARSPAGSRTFPERDRVLRWAPRSAGGARAIIPTARCGSSRARCAVFDDDIEPHRRGCGARRPACRAGLRAAGTGTSTGRREVGFDERRRLRVNPIACEAHGLCAELLPELIRLDDWGYPILDESEVPPDLLGLARRAVDACPTLALLLDED